MTIQRWPSSGPGRSHTVAHQALVWTVANARNLQGGFAQQVLETFRVLDAALLAANSCKERLLSVQVVLANIADRAAFDALWCEWLGPNPAHWPQRAVYGAALAPGLLVELIVTAAQNPGE